MDKLLLLLFLTREKFLIFISGFDFSFYMMFGISVLCSFTYMDFALLRISHRLREMWH